MSRRNVGLILLLAASVILGIVIGGVFYRLLLQTVPPAFLTSLNRAAALTAYVVSGAVAGVVICLWSLGAIALSRLFTGGKDAPTR